MVYRLRLKLAQLKPAAQGQEEQGDEAQTEERLKCGKEFENNGHPASRSDEEFYGSSATRKPHTEWLDNLNHCEGKAAVII